MREIRAELNPSASETIDAVELHFEVVEQRADIHRETAARVLHKEPADITADEAADGLLRRFDELDMATTGCFRTWDGRDQGGRTQASGVYFMRARQDRSTETYKMTLVK